ncbi:ATP-dependent helicase [Embleya sp. NBC_00896]|uniref:ATP-dependent helicase n=1 Tax=Embleya sp. NBC_00896 TaxID=2975961 RepID=UPI002F912B43|nr:ATP-dependent helicase [Embleya sp. NBC_00896]
MDTDDTSTARLWKDAAYGAGVAPDTNEFMKIRRLSAAGESLEESPPQYLEAVRLYEQALIDNDVIDFEAMATRALAVLRSSAPTRSTLAARFPHVLVDEYQDLGPVLHALVGELLSAGVGITAVGDPYQTLYGFQGADKRYFRRLRDRDDFTTIRLRVNFRSGSTLVAAADRTLGRDRGHRAAGDGEGSITVEHVQGGNDDHAHTAARYVADRIATGTPAEDIAVLHRGGAAFPPRMKDAFEQAGIAYDTSIARRIPRGPLADFVAACAALRITNPQPTEPQNRSTAGAPTLGALARDWNRKRAAAGHSLATDDPRATARLLLNVIDAPHREGAEDDATAFVTTLASAIELERMAADSPDQRDQDIVTLLRDACGEGITMAEMAGGRIPGRVTFTTYHGAKGREFTLVVLPCLIDGIVPSYSADKSPRALEADRQMFYVTRARQEMILLTGDHYTDNYNRRWNTRRSRFVDDMLSE